MYRRKNSTYIDKAGYKRYRNSGILVHRYIAERKLRRKLRDGEVVHHKNRNKRDNRRSNLWVFSSQKKHHTTHKKDKRRFGYW